MEYLVGKQKSAPKIAKVHLEWQEKPLVEVKKELYEYVEGNLKKIGKYVQGTVKFASGVVWGLCEVSIEPLLVIADILRYLDGAKTPWSLTGKFIFHVGKVGIEEAIIDIANGIIYLPRDYAKAFAKGEYFEMGKMTGYIVAGGLAKNKVTGKFTTDKTRIPINIVKKGNKIAIELAEDSIKHLRKTIMKKRNLLKGKIKELGDGKLLLPAKKRKARYVKELQRVENSLKDFEKLKKNPTIAILHSFEETFKKWVKEKMVPHIGEKLAKNIEKWEYVFGKDEIQHLKTRLRKAKGNPEELKKIYKSMGEDFKKTALQIETKKKILKYIQEEAKKKNVQVFVADIEKIRPGQQALYERLLKKLQKGEKVDTNTLPKGNVQTAIKTLQDLLEENKISQKDLSSYWVQPGEGRIFIHFPPHSTISLQKFVDEIAHAVQDLKGKNQASKQTPKNYYQEHMENFAMFGPKGKKQLRDLLRPEEQSIMGMIADSFKDLQKEFEHFISGK